MTKRSEREHGPGTRRESGPDKGKRRDNETTDIAAANVRVRESFAAVAENYRRSARHGDPGPLRLMLEVLKPRGNERVLDLATGGGHTAAALGPFVAEVVASDLLPEMLQQARELFAEAELSNVRLICADVHALPFATGAFDLVTCRCAPHHFGDVDRACGEIARCLSPGGRFYLNDCGAPDDAIMAEFVNEVERERDPSHVRALSATEWQEALARAGLHVQLLRELPSTYNVPQWLDHLAVPAGRRARVLARLANPPAGYERCLTIDLTPGNERFGTLRIEAVASLDSQQD